MVEINKDEIVQEEISNICRFLEHCEGFKNAIIECIEDNDEVGDLDSYTNDMSYTVLNLSQAIYRLEERLEERLDEIRERAIVNGEQQ